MALIVEGLIIAIGIVILVLMSTKFGKRWLRSL